MIKKLLKKIITATLTLITVIAAIFFILFLWFGFVERPMPFQGYAISTINNRLQPLELESEGVMLKFNRELNFLNIRVKEPKIEKAGRRVLALPDIIIKTNPLELLRGEGANLNFYIKDLSLAQQSLENQLSSDQNTFTSLNGLFSIIDSNKKILSQISLNFEDIVLTPHLTLSAYDIRLTDADQYFAEVQSYLKADTFSSDIVLRLTPYEDQIIIALSSDDLDLSHEFGTISVDANGLKWEAETVLHKNLLIDKLLSRIRGDAKVKFDGNKYTIKNFDASGNIDVYNKELDFQKIVLNVNDIPVSSQLKLSPKELDYAFAVPELDYKSGFSALPKKFITKTREWLVENIKKGDAAVEGEIQYDFADLKLDYKIKIPFSDVNLRYEKKLPMVEDAYGMVVVTPGNVKIDIVDSKLADFEGVEAIGEVQFGNKAASLQISALYESDDLEEVMGTLSKFIGKKMPKLDATAKTRNVVVVKLPLSQKINSIDDVDIRVESEVDFEKFDEIEKYKLEDLKLDVLYHNSELSFIGHTIYDQKLPLRLQYKKKVNGELKFNYADIDVIYEEDVQDLKHLFDVPSFLTGKTDIYIKLMPDSSIEISSDLKGLDIDAGHILLEKRAESLGGLQLKVENQEDKTVLSNIDFEVSPVLIKGDLEVMKDGKKFGEILYNNAEVGQIDMKYNGDSFSYSSKKLDFSKHNLFDMLSGSDSAKNNYKGAIGQMLLRNNVQINDLKLSNQYCPDCKFELSGGFSPGNGKINMVSHNNSILINSDDAGVLLKGLGVFEKLKGGVLHVKLDDNNKDEIEGVLNIDDFVILSNNFFVKLFALPSLTVSPSATKALFEGGGIEFEHFQCPLYITDTKIRFKKCVAKSKTINIRISGAINLENKTIDLEGLFIPQNVLNNVIQGIPILGEVLSGGKDAGVIAISFRIKGDLSEPKIVIDPLSTITPGITREIINLFK